MLKIENLHVTVDGKEILKGLDLEIAPGEVHAIMGPNGSGKSTLSYVLSGRDGYEVTSGSVTYQGQDLLEMEPEERAADGVFLAFQYPVELPGVSGTTFLKSALNAIRKHKGEPELDAMQFLKLVRAKTKSLNITDDMLRRGVNVGFSGGEKKRNEVLQMAVLEPALAILDETDSGLDIDALKIVADGGHHPLSAPPELHRAGPRACPGAWAHRALRRQGTGPGAGAEGLRRVRHQRGGVNGCRQWQVIFTRPSSRP